MPWQFSGGQGKEMVGMRGWSGGGGGMGGQPPSWHFPPAGGTGLRDTATTTKRAELGPTPAHCSEYQQNCRCHFSVFMIEFTDCVGVCVYFVFLISAIDKHYPTAILYNIPLPLMPIVCQTQKVASQSSEDYSGEWQNTKWCRVVGLVVSYRLKSGLLGGGGALLGCLVWALVAPRGAGSDPHLLPWSRWSYRSLRWRSYLLLGWSLASV